MGEQLSWISNETKTIFVWPNKRSSLPPFIRAHNNSRGYFNQVVCRLDKGDLAKQYPCALYVIYNNVNSNHKTVVCGVPQVSILGPLLFILYINDLCNTSTIMKFTLFADDTSMYHSYQNLTSLIDEVNNENKKITQWFHTNKLSLNIKKTNYIIFTSVNKKYNISSQAIQINGSVIPQVNLTKCLGVYTDEHLNWSMHLNKLATKLAQNIGILCKLKHFLPSYILNTIYCSLVLPHLQYCTLIWANTYCTTHNKLRMLQKLLGSLTTVITSLTLNRYLNRTIY